MEIIVTGATGFIGVALCQELIKGGHNVTAVVRKNSAKKNKLDKRVKIIELNLDELNKLEGKYDIFYHLAWNGSSGSDRNDFDIQMSNIKFTAEAMRAAVKCGCKKFIGAGSQAEYGVVRKMCNEDTLPKPFMMYGAAKLATYNMCNILAKQLGISFVWPRIYSVYGVGENSGTLMSYLVDCLKNNVKAELSPCENMWDFMYITDCVKALRLLGENSQTEGIYNVSAGKPKLLKEFVNQAKMVVNPKAEIEFGAKASDPKRTFWLEPDVRRLREIGFECEVEFDEGVRLKSEAKKSE